MVLGKEGRRGEGLWNILVDLFTLQSLDGAVMCGAKWHG